MTQIEVKPEIQLEIPPILPELTQYLIEARGFVERGWCKKSYINTIGSVCAVGGLEASERKKYGRFICTPFFTKARQLLQQSIPAHFAYQGTESYNDSLSTTKQDILDLYDRAIQLSLEEAE